MIIYYLLIAGLVLIDQLVKWWTVETFAVNTGAEFIPNLVSFYYIHNDGAAWGMLSGQMWFFFLITILVIGMLLFMLHREGKNHPLFASAIGFILAGALGNFIDRLRFGYVVDMFRLEFIDFPIFNVADACLTIGVILMFVYLFFFEEKKDKSVTTQKEETK